MLTRFPPSRPSPDEMFKALTSRDRALDGVFVAAIKTTGIFCRPGCGARRPRRENVEFFATPREALHAGYRPCLRCRPLENGEIPPEFITRALRLIESNHDRRLRAADLRAAHLSPERVTRYFKSRYGLTFQAYHRARRVGRALVVVRKGRPIPAAAGFASESGFHEAFQRLFGSSPARIHTQTSAIAPSVALMRWLPTPLGPMLAGACDEGICFLEFVDRRAFEAQISALRARLGPARMILPDLPDLPAHDINPASSPRSHLVHLTRQLAEYFAASRSDFTLPLFAPGTPFQEQVWHQLRLIEPGRTCSYLDLARAINRPTATRAVARANGDNRIAILIPCHRVIASDGSLSGYGGQVWRKQWLLEHEARTPITGRT